MIREPLFCNATILWNPLVWHGSCGARVNTLRNGFISASRRSARCSGYGGSDASIYAALCDLTLTRLGPRRINTRIASEPGPTRRVIIDPVMELCYLEWRPTGAAVVREGRAFCRSAGDERIILNSQEIIGARM